jgi:cell division protein FtsW (lipid II flippase)
MNLVTMITVKGFYTPAWLIPIVGAAVICICIVIGYIFEKKNVLNRISSHSNQNANPEFKELCLNVKEIRKTLEEK